MPETNAPRRGTKAYVHWCVARTYPDWARKVWWRSIRRELGCRSPAEAWFDGDTEAVTALAESLLGQIAT